MSRFSYLVLPLTILVLAGALQASAEVRAVRRKQPGPRTALVIGNGAYQKTPLKNAVNDANDMAEALAGCGFEVVKLINADRAAMRLGVREFASRINKGGVGLFFYAGHGIQVRGENYLVPLGADVKQRFEVEDQCLKVSHMLGAMEEAGNGLNIIILDACRNNPFRGYRGDKGGLAQMYAPTGSIIAFSTAPGAVAEDGDGRNGVYTGELLKHIRTPGLRLLDLFITVRNEVRAATHGDQVPWENHSLTAPFYFLPGRAGDKPKQAEKPDLEQEKLELERERLELARERERLGQERLAMGPKPERPEPAPRLESLPPKPGQTWTEPATGMEFVWIPGGCFLMGSPVNEAGRENGESQHEVCVDGFWVGKYEATNAQYRKFKPGHSSRDYKGRSLNSDRQPTVYVSWNDAKEYAAWLSGKGSGNYRLPTEAEWEYAARAGTTTARFWGDSPDRACSFANVSDKTGKTAFPNWNWETHDCDDGHAVSAPVGSFRPNGFGLYDMLGNVWEWCEDVYKVKAYSSHSRRNPINLSGRPALRARRGGSWWFRPSSVRSAARGWYIASERDGLVQGFRLVRTP